jgi:hypothetical protein
MSPTIKRKCLFYYLDNGPEMIEKLPIGGKDSNDMSDAITRCASGNFKTFPAAWLATRYFPTHSGLRQVCT